MFSSVSRKWSTGVKIFRFDKKFNPLSLYSAHYTLDTKRNYSLSPFFYSSLISILNNESIYKMDVLIRILDIMILLSVNKSNRYFNNEKSRTTLLI